jgi:hypothetical protein
VEILTVPNAALLTSCLDILPNEISEWKKTALQIQKIITEEKITDQEKPLALSPNSTLSVAGLMIALKDGWKPAGSVACLITGP